LIIIFINEYIIRGVLDHCFEQGASIVGWSDRNIDCVKGESFESNIRTK
jgi:hypothetical protein